MPKVILTYFDLKGLGESVRLLLSYGGQEFQDKRIKREDWPQIKDKYPFGQLPVLEVDGKQYAQSTAIARYLARKYGLAGDNEEEAFEIDQIIEFLNDVKTKAYDSADKDAQVKAEVVLMFEKLHEIITKNNGHLALGKLTFADFIFTGLYDVLKHFTKSYIKDFDGKFPTFKKLVQTVESLPKVKDYVAKRPKSDF